MKIYNSLSGEKEVFAPVNEGKVNMYVCGPTVYDLGHVGHARSAVAFDVVRKYLIYKGYEVKFVSNFTDIDDKMIKRADEEGISVEQLADKIIPEYVKDYDALGIDRPDFSPKATEHIDGIISAIKKLEDKGFVYVIDGDGVYFEVEKFDEYGKLSGQSLEDLQMGSRVDVNDKKRAAYDFALWKFKKEGEPFWSSPWGDGRPGWHIECSAMVEDVFGGGIDIHGGGVDLKFPHHECEVAQFEGANSCQFAKYWMHNGFIRIDNEKMSKSLGNFFTIRDVLKKYDPSVVRLFLLQKGYRSPIDFSDSALEQAKNGFERLKVFLKRLDSLETIEGGERQEVTNLISKCREKFESGMDDDFETSEALAAVYDLVRGVNGLIDAGGVTESDYEAINSLIVDFDSVLGVLSYEEDELSQEVMDLIEERNQARSAKDWAKSDELRDRLKNDFGIVVEDGPNGTTWKKV